MGNPNNSLHLKRKAVLNPDPTSREWLLIERSETQIVNKKIHEGHFGPPTVSNPNPFIALATNIFISSLHIPLEKLNMGGVAGVKPSCTWICESIGSGPNMC